MHYADLSKSKRLQRLMRYMSDGLPHSTLDIVRGAGVCAVNSAMAELRRNGINISPAKMVCTTADGDHVYVYQWKN